MFRLACSALFLAVVVSAAGCGEGTPETRFVSEAVAAPAQGPDYGWRTNAEPAGGDATVQEYY
jgi:hypothetical protein